MDRETFQSMLKAFGLKEDESHLEELFIYVQKIWPTLNRIHELDLTDLEPFMPSYPCKESI